MLCEKCGQQVATVHITEVNEVTSHQVKRHFCPRCAEAFQETDIIQRLLRRMPMIKLRLSTVSSRRTVVDVLGGPYDGETWSLVTARLRKFGIEPSSGQEFEIQDDQQYVDWLKGNRPSPESH